MTRPFTLWVFFLAFALRAETFSGKVIDPSGAAIPGARVAAVNRVGVVTQTQSDAANSEPAAIHKVDISALGCAGYHSGRANGQRHGAKLSSHSSIVLVSTSVDAGTKAIAA